jgi:hypothetical protein
MQSTARTAKIPIPMYTPGSVREAAAFPSAPCREELSVG